MNDTQGPPLQAARPRLLDLARVMIWRPLPDAWWMSGNAARTST